jgi:two-component system, OmpR family, response regulator
MAIGTRGARIIVVKKFGVTRQALVSYLSQEFTSVTTAASREEMSRQMALAEPGLVLLDLRLGHDDGLDLLRQIRSRSNVPVIITTDERAKEIDRVAGLELGADDCLSEPFGLRELLARIRTVLRRAPVQQVVPKPKADLGRHSFNGWHLHRRTRRLTNPDGAPVALTKSEYALLVALLSSSGRPLTRRQLLDATSVLGDASDRSIDTMVLRLRRKLQPDPKAPAMIQTARGVGYRLALTGEGVHSLRPRTANETTIIL